MKKILFLLSTAFVLKAAKAQSDTVNITLTAHQHAFVIAYMPDRAQVSRNKYIFTVAPKIEIVKDSTGKNRLKNPDQPIGYAAPVALLEDLFLSIGSNQERLVASDNRAIQLSLIEQLQRRPDVLQRIGILVQKNAQQNDEVIQNQGIDYIANLKE